MSGDVPAGMKPWAGGVRPPDDWDGGAVLHRRIGLDWPITSNGGRWTHSDPANHTKHAHDIIAYTSLPTPAQTASGVEL